MAAKTPPTRYTAADLTARIRTRYEQRGEHAVFTNVANGAGAPVARYADAIAINLWRSRGLSVHGFEVKVDRRDWQRELAAPAKAEAFSPYCHHWWIVAPLDVAHADELPPTWGLLVPHGDGLRIERQAPAQDAQLTHGFLASIARRATQQGDDGVVRRQHEQAVADAYRRGQTEAREAWEQREARDTAAHRELLNAVVEFEQASGMTIRHREWDAGRIGGIVRLLRDKPDTYSGALGDLLRAVQSVDRIKDALIEWETFRRAQEVTDA